MKAIIKYLHRWKLKWIVIFIVCVFITAFAGYLTIVYGGKLIVEEEDFILPAATTIETMDGHTIGEIYDEKRYPISIDQVPEHVKNAFVAIEDRRFYKHGGVDFRSVMRAIYRDIISKRKAEGGSTITQQLAKNLFLNQDKTWMRKTKEVMAAIYLEREFTKDQILELYLNKVYFGNEIYGIEAASRHFFSKSVQSLSLNEGAMLAGLIQAPNQHSPMNHPENTIERRNTVLQAMEREKMISTKKRIKEERKQLGLDIAEIPNEPQNNSYIDLVMKEAAREYQLSIKELKRGGYRLIVNLDEKLQKVAYESFQQDEYFPGNTEGVEGAFTMYDWHTGRIVAALGGRNYELGDLNRLTVNRQPGSTIKPLAVYAPAMMKEAYHPYSLLKDELMDYDDHFVANVDDQYDGVISLYDAIVTSKNAPAVWLLSNLGVDYAKSYLKKMHIDLDDDGLAIALGGLTEGVTPLDLVQGYSAFANGGKAVKPYTIERIYDQDGTILHQAKLTTYDIFHPQVAWNMTEILQSTVERGTASSGNYSKALAGKTGSTEHPHVKGMVKDAWFVGYTPDYVVATWMGYDQSDDKHYLTGDSSNSVQLTKEILTKVDQTMELTGKFTKPDDVNGLQEPKEIFAVQDLSASFTFGRFPFMKGKLTWKGNLGDRLVYRIYQEGDPRDKRIGEVMKEEKFIIEDISLFQKNYYYIVPYDPETGLEGESSEVVELSL